MHDFEEKKREGEYHEGILERYYSHEYKVTRVDDFMQRRGNDRIFAPLDGGPAFGVEFKADSRAAETGNAFIETESVAGVKHGWALTATAPLLIYYIPPNHIAYEIPLPRVRAKVDEWKARYKTKAAQNADYQTLGVIVPLRELIAIATRSRFIPPDGDPDGDGRCRVEVKEPDGWRPPLWGGDMRWSVAQPRVEIARRLWPGIAVRVSPTPVGATT